MSKTENTDVQKMKESYQVLAFIHSKLLSTNYYPEEFKIADAALRLITDMCNQMAQDIDAIESKEKHEEEKSE